MITQLTVWRLYTKYGALVWSLLQCGVAQIERYCVSDHRWHVTNPLPSYLNFFLMRRWIIPENCLKKEGNWSLGCNNSMLRRSFSFLQENYLYTFLGVALPHCRQWLHCHLSTLSFFLTDNNGLVHHLETNNKLLVWTFFEKKARNTG